LVGRVARLQAAWHRGTTANIARSQPGFS